MWTSIYAVLFNKEGAVHPLPFIKYWMELNGMAAGPVRPPMHNMTQEQKDAFKARLEASGWMEKLFPARYGAKKLAAAE